MASAEFNSLFDYSFIGSVTYFPMTTTVRHLIVKCQIVIISLGREVTLPCSSSQHLFNRRIEFFIINLETPSGPDTNFDKLSRNSVVARI